MGQAAAGQRRRVHAEDARGQPTCRQGRAQPAAGALEHAHAGVCPGQRF